MSASTNDHLGYGFPNIYMSFSIDSWLLPTSLRADGSSTLTEDHSHGGTCRSRCLEHVIWNPVKEKIKQDSWIGFQRKGMRTDLRRSGCSVYFQML
jgi:hypothetical protein